MGGGELYEGDEGCCMNLVQANFPTKRHWLQQERQALREEQALYGELKLDLQTNQLLLKEEDSTSEDCKKLPAVYEEMTNIKNAVKNLYQIDIDSQDENQLNDLLKNSHFPYLRVILRKYHYLKKLSEARAPLERVPVKKSSSQESLLKEAKLDARESSFEFIKKILGLLDNTWSGFQSLFLPQLPFLLSSIFTGVFGFVLLIGEGVEGAVDAFKAYRKETTRQRKTRMVTNILAFMMAGAGMGFSLALLVGAAGVAISSMTITLAPLVISCFFMAIYSLSLWRNSYILHRAREEEALAAKELSDYRKISAQVEDKEREIKALHIQGILNKKDKHQHISDQEGKIYQDYLCRMQELLTLQSKAIELKVKIEQHKSYQTWHRRKLYAERTLVFNIMDIIASSLALVATILGTAALLGASVASFGTVPLVLLILGVVLGVASQLFENIDSRKQFVYTKGIRDYIISLWNHLTCKNPQHQSLPYNHHLHKAHEIHKAFSDKKCATPQSVIHERKRSFSISDSPLPAITETSPNLTVRSPRKAK